MVLTRLIRVINVSIAILVVIIAVTVYWYAMRPLPKTSGEIEAPISGVATVERDARGIPHIQASTWQDAIFLQGYVTAQDRLWQMDGLRRFGAGDLSEVFGRATLAQDERSRRMRMRAIAQADVRQLSDAERGAFVEYARGVNYFIDTHRGSYSLEFSLPGHAYDPRPWTIADSILVGLVMFRDLTDGANVDLYRERVMSAAADPAKAKILFPAIQGQFVSPGSNAWAVAGSRTVDGKPIVANDPHLAYGIPCTWHLVHLKAPGLNVSGGALPGVPGVITGHNEQIAWGVTNLQPDVMDLYREQLDERTGRYLYRGQVQQAQLDTELIGVRDAKPIVVNIWITGHGPVLASGEGKSYTMRWSAAEGFSFPFWAIDRAQNWEQFRAALSTFWGPAQNFVFGDRAGNIGYQAAGRVPIRPNFDGDVPLDGASGKFEWDGYIPFEEMPSSFNPPSGFVATANQDPFPPKDPKHVPGSYADPYRIEQIRALLQRKPKLGVSDMLAIQKDVYSAYDYFLAQQVMGAVAKRGAREDRVREAAEVLRHWNGQMDKDESAPMITELLSNRMGAELVASIVRTPDPPAETHRGSDELDNAGAKARYRGAVRERFRVDILPRPRVIQKLLTERPEGWVPGDDWDAWILKQLDAALDDGRNRQGSPVSRWRWGKLLQWSIQHPVGKQLPFLDAYFDIGPVQMSGSGTCVKQTTTTMGPSERMVVDMGDLDKSVQNLPTGESGFVASGHYKDQWPAYYAGTSFPMQFNHVDAKETLRIKPVPQPSTH